MFEKSGAGGGCGLFFHAMLIMLMHVTWVMEIGDNQNKMQHDCTDFFFSPKNTSLIIHDASYLPTPDVASVCYVALIYVKDEELLTTSY